MPLVSQGSTGPQSTTEVTLHPPVLWIDYPEFWVRHNRNHPTRYNPRIPPNKLAIRFHPPLTRNNVIETLFHPFSLSTIYTYIKLYTQEIDFSECMNIFIFVIWESRSLRSFPSSDLLVNLLICETPKYQAKCSLKKVHFVINF